MSDAVADPFALHWSAGFSPCGRLRSLDSLLERVLGLSTLNRLYGRLPDDGRPFADRALDGLGVRYEIVEGELSRVPRAGALVIVANHPFGGIDGLIVMSLLGRVRPDVKLLGNYLLSRIPELRDSLFPVDPFGSAARKEANVGPVLSAVRWLKSGGALVVFPAGEVAHARSADGTIVDSPWATGVGRVVRSSRADVLPIFFEGHNSRTFFVAGQIDPRFRTALLPRELLKARGRVIRLRVGSCIPASRLTTYGEPERLMSYLRVRTYALGSAGHAHTPHAVPSADFEGSRIAEAQPHEGLEKEIRHLDGSHVLLRNGPFDVCIARAGEIPKVLKEIGRLREIAFRAAGEGSGKPRDLDLFDEHYLHLFVWQRDRREIAGAYRVGGTDEILPRFGIPGLYTSTLFKYDPRLLTQIDPALELGRAFVRREYQRDYSPLLLLWKGIAAFVVRNPQYRILFGPVSISNSYRSLSRQILACFLYATSYRRDLGALLEPRNPPLFLRQRGGLLPVAAPIVKTLAEVGTLLAEIEADQKGVPVLLRQYLKLNARLLGFNLDPSFGSVLDGLMLVDLTDVDRGILGRYMGASQAEEYLGFHGVRARRHAS